jgi:hypothetical protein
LVHVGVWVELIVDPDSTVLAPELDKEIVGAVYVGTTRVRSMLVRMV